MHYEDVQNKLNELCKFAKKSNSKRFKILMLELGSPQENLKAIHVAGTNGKGSVCTFISSVLSACGYKTGLFLSPFVFEFGERISVDKIKISANDFLRILNNILPKIKKLTEIYGDFTQFEIITAVAFLYFKEQNCDIIVLETGIGGRLDATNIIKNPLLCAITSISIDHTNMLGKCIKEIANEKAGIIKKNSTVVLYPNAETKVIEVIKQKCLKENAKYFIADANVKILEQNLNYTLVELSGEKIKLNLAGEHQINNLKTAICVLNLLKQKGLDISFKDIIKGIESAYIPGRLEIISQNPLFIADGAHNFESANALKNYIKLNLKGKKIIAITAMMKDKDSFNFFKLMQNCFDEIITVEIENIRARSADDLKKTAKKFFKDVISFGKDIDKAVNYARKRSNSDTAVVACGSFYLVGKVKNI